MLHITGRLTLLNAKTISSRLLISILILKLEQYNLQYKTMKLFLDDYIGELADTIQ